MGKRGKAVHLTGASANAMLSIWSALQKVPSGVPVKVHDHPEIIELERIGFIERHHVGTGVGVTVTAKGAAFVRDAMRHVSN